jgi:hypothetical protein
MNFCVSYCCCHVFQLEDSRQSLTHALRPPEALFFANVVLNVEKKEISKENDSDEEKEIAESPMKGFFSDIISSLIPEAQQTRQMVCMVHWCFSLKMRQMQRSTSRA